MSRRGPESGNALRGGFAVEFRNKEKLS